MSEKLSCMTCYFNWIFKYKQKELCLDAVVMEGVHSKHSQTWYKEKTENVMKATNIPKKEEFFSFER